MSLQRLLQGVVLAAGLALAGQAQADDPLPAHDAGGLEAGGDEVLGLEELEALAGGEGVSISMITQQSLTAINNGNTVSGETISSGDVTIAHDAFSGFDGIGNFVINTGHNNNLQSTMSVNIVLAP